MTNAKFRALTLDTKEEVKGYYCKVEGRHYIIDNTVSHTWLEEDVYEIQGLIEVDPETVRQLAGKDKNDKEIYQADEVWLKRDGFNRMRCVVLAGFESWVWLFWMDNSTYRWETAYYGDIELIEDRK